MKRRPVAQFMFPASHSRAEEYALRIEQTLPQELQRPDVRAGLVEAITNAILHGAFGIQRESEDVERYLDAIDHAERTRAGKALIGVTVRARKRGFDVIVNDYGPGFDWRRALRKIGRGLSILHEVFEDVRWNAGGNCIRLTIGETEKRGGK